jgi:hypothetical protein
MRFKDKVATAGLEFTAEVLEGQVEKPHEVGMAPEIAPEGGLGDLPPIPAARLQSGNHVERYLLS